MNYQETNGYWVYAHVTPDGLYYVGMSKQQPFERWKVSQYKSTSLSQYITEYEWDNIEHKILIDGLSKEQAEQWEDRLIQALSINGLCINKNRSGGIYRDNKKAYDKQHNKQYREEHQDDIKQYRKQYNKQYREEHQDDIKQYSKQWYEEHKEERKAYNKQYNTEHKEERKEYFKQRLSTPEWKIYYRVASYNHNHPDKVIETPMEAKTKYLETGYIPEYIKNYDLK